MPYRSLNMWGVSVCVCICLCMCSFIPSFNKNVLRDIMGQAFFYVIGYELLSRCSQKANNPVKNYRHYKVCCNKVINRML